MATQDTSPKQTNQGAEGRKDEQKGVQVGQDIGKANPGNGEKAAKGGRNSQGGEWGKNKGKGGNDSHNKR